ncbi:MAG: CHASE2 domain-containing protein, partial [Rariglobus sp.]
MQVALTLFYFTSWESMRATLLQFLKRHRMTWLLCALATTLCGGAWHMAALAQTQQNWTFPLRRAEWLIQDLLLRKGAPVPINKDLVFLGIDSQNYGDRFFEDEVEEMPVLGHFAKNYPWSREVWGALVDRLADAGAKAIVFDLLFVAPANGDEAFAQALKRHEDKVVLAANLTISEADGK